MLSENQCGMETECECRFGVGDPVEREPMWDGNKQKRGHCKTFLGIFVEREPMWDDRRGCWLFVVGCW